jgi:hypothetical protein
MKVISVSALSFVCCVQFLSIAHKHKAAVRIWFLPRPTIQQDVQLAEYDLLGFYEEHPVRRQRDIGQFPSAENTFLRTMNEPEDALSIHIEMESELQINHFHLNHMCVVFFLFQHVIIMHYSLSSL